jgi:hypothetical protein
LKLSFSLAKFIFESIYFWLNRPLRLRSFHKPIIYALLFVTLQVMGIFKIKSGFICFLENGQKKWLLFTTISFGDSISHGKSCIPLFHQHHTPRESESLPRSKTIH